jgi:aspartate kinase
MNKSPDQPYKPTMVYKFGGTSVADASRIRRAAARILSDRHRYRQVVVVSAMAGETDRLLALGLQFGAALDTPRQREFDALVSTGEQVSAALMAMAFQEAGVPARSLTAHQAKVRADSKFQKARIKSIDCAELLASLRRGEIAVVTGFQGVDTEGNIVTLGRGGSDTTAVAFAVALGAKSCEIFTDVEGVFTADPRRVPSARKLKTVFFDEMIELASSGSKVLQIRSVELAMKSGMEIHVRSSFVEEEGTRVITENEDMEALVVTGLSHDDNQAKVTIIGLNDHPDILAKALEPLALSNIVIDLITQNIGLDNKMTVAFTLNDTDLELAKACLQSNLSCLGSPHVTVERELTKVSVVGIGMRTHSGVAQKVFALLSKMGIPIHMALSTEIKVSCLIPMNSRDTALAVLHKGFNLDNELSSEAGAPL